MKWGAGIFQTAWAKVPGQGRLLRRSETFGRVSVGCRTEAENQVGLEEIKG